MNYIKGDSATIDLRGLVHGRATGSSVDISLFVEDVSTNGFSDRVSKNPLSFSVEVGLGPEHTITYDVDGGKGATIPALMKVRAGASIILANGSGLAKGPNLFTRWLAKYSEEEGAEINLLFYSGENIIMPDADVEIVAKYAGMQIGKGTETQGATNYLITWDLNGGYLGGYSQKRVYSLVRKGEKYKSPGNPSKNGLEFAGWFTSSSGGNKIDIENVSPTENTTLYAQYDYSIHPDYFGGGSMTVDGKTYSDAFTFLAPAGSDPRDIRRNKGSVNAYSITMIKKAADLLRKGINPLPDVFNSTNDAWHLYGNYDLTSSWYEYRIIHTGQHDGDGSGLTFQMVHGLSSRFMFGRESDTEDKGWGDSFLRYWLNNPGNRMDAPFFWTYSIYDYYPLFIRLNALAVPKKYNYEGASIKNGGIATTSGDKFWIISATEMFSNISRKDSTWWYNDDNAHGSTYDFWRSKDLKFRQPQDSGTTQRSLLNKMCRDASGKLLATFGQFPNYTGASWLRSKTYKATYSQGYFNHLGRSDSQDGAKPREDKLAVNVCFCL